jgi:hypothetical protein
MVGPPMPTRFRSGPDTLATRVGDEIVLVHTGTDRIFALNRTGARVWDLLCGEHDRAAIESRLAAEYDVAPAELSAEVGALLDALIDGRLIDVLPHG